jgi:uncharacterized membrane-anchored protein
MTLKKPTLAQFNKVPEVTIYFWTVKILSTTVGETAADLLSVRLGWGLTITSIFMGLIFIAALCWQIKTDIYRPPVYWMTVVLISILGTLISDNLVDGMGVSLVSTSVGFGACLAVVFVAWYYVENTLSIQTIYTTRRELFYWSCILFTFAMGTSVGDLIAEHYDLGYAQAVILFAGMIAVVAFLYFVLRLNAIFCFWLAYILTRPLGASVGDWYAKPVIAGGLGWGTVTTSVIFLVVIFLVVAFLSVTKSDQIGQATQET